MSETSSVETPTIKTSAIETTNEKRMQQLVGIQTRLLNALARIPDAPALNVEGSALCQAMAQECLVEILTGAATLANQQSAFLSSGGEITFRFKDDLSFENTALFCNVAKQASECLKKDYGYDVSWRYVRYADEIEFVLRTTIRSSFLNWRLFFSPAPPSRVVKFPNQRKSRRTRPGPDFL
ncbi:MAG: hypothetical protein Q8T09_01795 [Candidatus Melainabacteria bacterium]|nr:hypothetical protein [Candidatus Melainabacteria bacterium]